MPEHETYMDTIIRKRYWITPEGIAALKAAEKETGEDNGTESP